jgi:hypothetical protein
MKENPSNVQTSACECCKRSGAGAHDGDTPRSETITMPKACLLSESHAA